MASTGCCFPEIRSGCRGEWKAVLLRDSDRAAYLTSLATVMEVEFDVLVPWDGEDGQPYAYPVTPAEGQERLGRIAARLQAGGNA